MTSGIVKDALEDISANWIALKSDVISHERDLLDRMFNMKRDVIRCKTRTVHRVVQGDTEKLVSVTSRNIETDDTLSVSKVDAWVRLRDDLAHQERALLDNMRSFQIDSIRTPSDTIRRVVRVRQMADGNEYVEWLVWQTSQNNHGGDHDRATDIS